MRAKNKSERENMKMEITQWGKKRVFEMMNEKKRKKVRKGKRVREKWFVLDVFSGYHGSDLKANPLKRKGKMQHGDYSRGATLLKLKSEMLRYH